MFRLCFTSHRAACVMFLFVLKKVDKPAGWEVVYNELGYDNVCFTKTFQLVSINIVSCIQSWLESWK